MPTTIARPLTNGANVAIYNGAGTAIYEAGLGAGDLVQILGAAGGLNLQSILTDALSALLTSITNAIFGSGSGGPVATLDDLVPISDDLTSLKTWANLPGTTFDTRMVGVEAALMGTDLPTHKTIVDLINNGVPVSTLPQPPPSGYGGATANDIWLATYQTTGVTFADLVARAGTQSWYNAYYGSQNLANAPWFSYDNTNALQAGLGNPPAVLQIPRPNWSAVGLYATPLEWLNATDAEYGGLWAADIATGLPFTDVDISTTPHIYTTVRCMITAADWAVLQGQAGVAGNLPPVWPGLANVTLGTPVALADQLVVAGPLHGVIVDVTGGGGKLGLIELGGKKYYYRAGEITFETDNGQLEPWQYIGFEDAIYCPRAMVSADNARFRVLGALTGTATPFTINP